MKPSNDDDVRGLLAVALNVQRSSMDKQQMLERVLREIGPADFIAIPEPQDAQDSQEPGPSPPDSETR